MTSRSKLLLAGIIAAGVVAILIYRGFFVSKNPQYEFIEIKRGTVIEEVSETGKVVSPEEIDLYFKNPGQVAEVKVKEGDTALVGQALMRLDTKELFIKEREAGAALASTQAKYSQALAGATNEDIKVYETALANAQKNLIEAKNSAAEQVVASQKEVQAVKTTHDNLYETLKNTLRSNIVTMSTALTDIDNIFGIDNTTSNDAFENNLGAINFQTKIVAETSYKDAKFLKQEAVVVVDGLTNTPSSNIVELAAVKVKSALNKVISALEKTKAVLDYTTTSPTFTVADLNAKKSTIDTDRTLNTTSLSNLETGEQNISSAKNTLEVSQAKLASVKAITLASVVTAEGAVNTTQDQLAAKKAPLREVDKEVYLAAIASSQASLDLIRQQINEATLYAPMTGVIADADLKIGELATSLVRALSMISTNLEIEADVSELDIRKIIVGGYLTATFDALGQEQYQGKVIKIAPREKLKDEDIFYKVAMVLEQPAPLRSGMTADVSIKVGERNNVLTIPGNLLIKRGGRYFAQVLVDGALKEREIKIGLQGEDLMEVIDGLSEGEKIVAKIK